MGTRLTVDYFNGSLDLYAEDVLRRNPKLSRIDITEGLSADVTLKGQMVAFGSHVFDDYYQRIRQQLSRSPLGDLYDVPEAGLKDASLMDILDWVYQYYVLGQRQAPLRKRAAATAS